jgi:tRNA(fMet)-specific endonuclease VapC
VKFVLDTNLITVIIDGNRHPLYDRLAGRLDQVPGGPVVTIVSSQETMKGWLAYCAKARTPEKYIDAARKLHVALDFYSVIEMLDLDTRAADLIKRLEKANLKIGTMDLRIASIVLAHDATLLSANLSDFRKVPGLKVEDWSA